MSKFVLYESACSLHFFQEGKETEIFLEKDSVKIWEIDAPTFEIAQMKKHEFLKWEPYKPYLQDEIDLYKYLPKDKNDIDNAKLLINLGYPIIKPVLHKILEWMQDMNWPVADVFKPFLISIGKPLIPYLVKILNSDDYIWKYWILNDIVKNLKSEDLMNIQNIIKRIAETQNESEVKESVHTVAQEIIEKIKSDIKHLN
jgi:hypothetical protein